MIRLSAAALAAGIIAAVAAVGAGSSTARATLRVSGKDPIIVQGSHFRPRESVRVTITFTGTRKARTIHAGRTGVFAASFDVPLPFDPCTDSLLATAKGSSGDSAQAKLPQRACPPPA